MTTNKVKITAIGNSFGVILPKSVLERLRVSKGDQVLLVETANGIELTPFDPVVARQMEFAERVMREDRDVLRKLAE
jgi:putative addiction module antidote